MRTFHFQFIGILMGILLTVSLFSQSVGINEDSSQPNAAAILDIKSSNKGLLIPRTDTTTINTLGTPTNGLIIYQTSDEVFYYYDGERWRGLSVSDEKVFERDGTLIRQKGNVDTDDFIFGRDALPANGEIALDTFLLFDQSKGAFRAGRLLYSPNWSPDSIGFASFACGYNTIAKGDYSNAWGYKTKAMGSPSTAWGIETKAIGYNSTAWGINSKATGVNSTTWGSQTVAPSAYETVLGSYNTDYTPNSDIFWNTDDRLFVVGNGETEMDRSNALTILKNGNTTLKGEFTLTDGTSAYTLPNTDGTADQVLATDGAGIMSWTDRDDFGVFERDGTLIRQKDHVDDDDFIFGRDALPKNGVPVTDTFFFFDQSKGAFRAGRLLFSQNWSPDSIGVYSFAHGDNAKATGGYSAAWGYITEAKGENSTAWGSGTKATGSKSTAWGSNSKATGNNSTAWGNRTVAPSAYETVLGHHNTAYSPNSSISWDTDDRLFVIGNGTGVSNKSNALTILKNGCMGLQNENTPTYALQLPNNSSNDIGKGRAYEWSTYSDMRVKSRQKQLVYGLSEILKLQPKSYFQHNSRWENDALVIDPDEGKEAIGLIAQEVYDIIPEVVQMPEDENVELWGMDYEKLVPVLINAIQEQQQMIEQLEQSQLDQQEIIEKLLAEKQTMK